MALCTVRKACYGINTIYQMYPCVQFTSSLKILPLCWVSINLVCSEMLVAADIIPAGSGIAHHCLT